MPSLAVLGMTLKGSTHDPGPWRLYEGLQGKPFFIEPYIFCHDSYEWKIDLELGGGGGSCQSWGEPLVGGMKVASHYEHVLKLEKNGR